MTRSCLADGQPPAGACGEISKGPGDVGGRVGVLHWDAGRDSPDIEGNEFDLIAGSPQRQDRRAARRRRGPDSR
jgi:hypothetical protein